MIVDSRIACTVKNLQLMILEAKIITWQIQNAENSWKKKLLPILLSEFDFIVEKKVPSTS